MPGIVVIGFGDGVMPYFPYPCRDSYGPAKGGEYCAVVGTIGIAVYIHCHHGIMALPVARRCEMVEVKADEIPDGKRLFFICFTATCSLQGNGFHIEPIVLPIYRNAGIHKG